MKQVPQEIFLTEPSLTEKFVRGCIILKLVMLLNSTDKIVQAHKSVRNYQQIFNDSHLAWDHSTMASKIKAVLVKSDSNKWILLGFLSLTWRNEWPFLFNVETMKGNPPFSSLLWIFRFEVRASDVPLFAARTMRTYRGYHASQHTSKMSGSSAPGQQSSRGFCSGRRRRFPEASRIVFYLVD